MKTPAGPAPNLLELVPHPQARSEPIDDGRLALLLPRFGAGWLGRWVDRCFHPKPLRLRLDEIGSATWQLLDGRRRVEDIARALQQKFGDKVEPVHDRLNIFFRQLEQQKLIVMTSPERDKAFSAKAQ
ncbi:MAG: PqqD family protein [candidate division KSB1 bacterium]|nr:PqqD family protein [candidate division KSB1 bacterium]MDZ7365287.1 PqqD family protein [candidate division KSB1 bacterium]MDZ7403154.1 PqqD family protein [candidate division KSB1 bacterium]